MCGMTMIVSRKELGRNMEWKLSLLVNGLDIKYQEHKCDGQ